MKGLGTLGVGGWDGPAPGLRRACSPEVAWEAGDVFCLGQGLNQLLPPSGPCAPSLLIFPFCKQTSRWGNRDSKKVKAGI